MQPLMEWLSNPIWIEFGVVALLLIVVIIAVAATHGRGPTVMKE
jgi:hypothetical protein